MHQVNKLCTGIHTVHCTILHKQ